MRIAFPHSYASATRFNPGARLPRAQEDVFVVTNRFGTEESSVETVETQLKEAAKFVKEQMALKNIPAPKVAIILGSGLGGFGEHTDAKPLLEIPYEDIRGFIKPKVDGHAGKLIFYKLPGGTTAAILSGRSHYYEGHTAAQIGYPVQLLQRLGAENLIVTNAAGGVNRRYEVGDFMILDDHINFTGDNALRGPNLEPGPRFPAMNNAYTKSLRKMAKQSAKELGLKTHEGVYMQVGGPNYEAPAEIRLFRKWGVDAVGMSTVLEVIAAKQAGYKNVLGISCITNKAAGMSDIAPNHAEVQATADSKKPAFMKWMDQILTTMEKHDFDADKIPYTESWWEKFCTTMKRFYDTFLNALYKLWDDFTRLLGA